MLQKQSRWRLAIPRRPVITLCAALTLAGAVQARAQIGNPLVEQLANKHIALEELGVRQKLGEITPEQYRAQFGQTNLEIRAMRGLLAKLPRDQQVQIMRDQESLFRVRIVPLREQWRQQLVAKQQDDRSRDAARRTELTTDAELAGKLQAARVLLVERARRGEISEADATRNDQLAEQQLLALQHKYDAYGPAWGTLFSRAVAPAAQRVLAETRQRQKSAAAAAEKDARAAVVAAAPPAAQPIPPAVATQAPPQQASPQRVAPQQQVPAQQPAPRPVRSEPNVASAPPPPPRATRAPSTSAGMQRGAANVPPPPSAVGSFPVAQRRQQSGSSSGMALLWLLGLGGAGAGAYAVARRRRAPRVANYADLKTVLPTAEPARAAPAPPRPATAAADPARVAAGTDASSATSASPGLKERLFLEQREKYQARYNDAVDEMTNASMELGQKADVARGIQNNLKQLATTLHDRVVELVKQQHMNTGKLLRNAALGMPVYRFFKRGGMLLKVAIAVVAFLFLSRVVGAIMAGNVVAGALPYLIVVAVFFFVERHLALTKPLKDLQGVSGNFKAISLAYVYADQAPHLEGAKPMYHAVSIAATGDRAQPRETRVSAVGSDGNGIASNTFLLTVGELASYWIDASGNISPAKLGSTDDFMRNHGQLVHQALSEQKAFAAHTLGALADYGAASSRRRRAAEQVPRLEQLVQSVDRMEAVWRNTYVGDPVFDFLLRRIDLFNVRDSATPSGILLHGYPGNGRAHLARKIAESVSAHLEEVNAATFNSAAAVTALWEKSRGKPTVLFVENAEHVFPRPGSEHEGGGTREVTLAWVSEWGRFAPAQSMVWVVMTVQNEKDLHPAILNQLGSSRIEVAAPTSTGRQLILGNACRENQLPTTLPDWLVAATGGASVRELYEIVKETKLQSTPYAPTDDHWRAAANAIRGSDAAFKDDRKTWDRLVLPAEIKDQLLRASRILRDAEAYLAKGVNVPNVLLFGPPGTGKTDIARTFANEGGVKFLMATTADMKAEYIGQSAHLVRNVFAKARAVAPAVLFIDEIESIAAKRGSKLSDSFTQEIVTEMLAQMDGARKSDRPVFVLGATNLPEEIDPAILSRFTSKIEIPLPDEAARAEMLKRLLRERTIDPAMDVDEIAATLAKRLPRKSGRDLVMLINRAMERAVLVADSPEDIRLTRELLLAEIAPQGRAVSDADLNKVWSQIVLKGEVRDSILSKIRLFNSGDRAAPRGLLLYGPPGTGKTEIARRIADSTSSYFMPLTGSDLKSGYVGQSGQSVRGIWEKARSRGKCVIFVDECEGVFARRGGVNTDSASEEVVREFLAMWDGVGSEGQVWVVGATNRRDQLDEAIVSRFGAAVEIGLPEAPERLEILRLEMSKLEREAAIPDFVGQSTAGFAGRDLATVARDVCSLAAERRVAIEPEMWREVIGRYAKASSESVDEHARWSSLVVSPDTMEKLQTVCESLRHIETLRKQGIQPPKGALLYGPPGTGKTQIARTIANESGLPFLAASTADVKAGFVGQSGQKVRELFERARGKAPCVLFIDEIESVVPSRGGGGDQFTDEIVTQMLQELDGVRKSERHVFVLAATNHPEKVDSAILSRFPDRISIPNPGLDERRRLFQIALARQPRASFDVDEVAAELARLATTASGRDIQSLVSNASQLAVQRALKAGTPDQVVLTREDVVSQFAPKGASELSDADIEKVWSQIVLDPAVKTSILGKIRLFNSGDRAAPRGLLLYGPPGTGKTEIARRLAESTSSHFMPLTGSDLKAGYVGQSGQYVKRVWAEARAHPRTVIFVDECEGVFARRGGVNTDSASEELVREFLAMWDGVGAAGQVWVVGATNRRDQLDEAIVSRFGAAVEIALPGVNERAEILRLEMRKLERDVLVPDFVGRATAGMAGRDLAQVARDLCALALDRGGVITDGMWTEVISRHAKAGSAAVDDGARWAALIVSDETMGTLQAICRSLKHVEALRKQGIAAPRSAILYGPPGTGKTQIARTLANESGLAFLAATTADLKAGYVGQSGQKVRELFERARGKAPCILFIDEIDVVTPDRGSAWADAYSNEIVTQMLQELDGVKRSEQHVFVLAATNLLERVDAAILSRFEEKIEVPNPSASQRRQLFKTFLAGHPVNFNVDEVVETLTLTSGDISGREIRSIVQRGLQQAAQRTLMLDAETPGEIVLGEGDLMEQLRAQSNRGQLNA